MLRAKSHHSERMRSKTSQVKGTRGRKSGGNQAQAPKGPLPAESHSRTAFLHQWLVTTCVNHCLPGTVPWAEESRVLTRAHPRRRSLNTQRKPGLPEGSVRLGEIVSLAVSVQ